MTELDLLDAIKKVLKYDILPNLSIFGAGEEIQVFKHDLPLSTDFEDEDDKYFPCAIVRLQGADIKTADDPQFTTTEIIICLKDYDDDMSGLDKIIVTIARIRDYFTANAGIIKKFRLKYPIKINVDEEVAPPYFKGSLIIPWQTEVAPYNDIQKFL